jgi:glycine betaine/proline transport system substrate-binding protein
MKWKLAAVALALASVCLQASAADAPSCRNVRFADVGWSDIAATTGLASVVLEGLGYAPSLTFASIPVALAGLKNKQIDVFLGYWSPTMTAQMEPFVAAGQITVLDQPNLVGARYSLAVPQYLYDRGLKNFADIARFRKELQGKIYGIEPGSDGNVLIQAMIRDPQFSLQDFQLVESSEADMLAQAQRAASSKKAIVFLGWEPHPMNTRMKMRYLAGGDEVFGANLGEAKVYTAVAQAYEARCPNVATFLHGLQFSTDMENQVMGPILQKVRPHVAARNFLRKNPAVVERWLKGVTTFDGRDGLAAVVAFLKRPG